MSHFYLIAGVVLFDWDYKVVGSQLLLLSVSEIIPGLAGTLGDWRLSQFTDHVCKKPLVRADFRKT